MKENEELLNKCANEIISLNKLSEDNICYTILFISSNNGEFKTEFKVVKYQIFINVKSDLNFGNKHISITEFEPLDFLSFAESEIEYYHKEKADEIRKQFQEQLRIEEDIRKAEELTTERKKKMDALKTEQLLNQLSIMIGETEQKLKEENIINNIQKKIQKVELDLASEKLKSGGTYEESLKNKNSESNITYNYNNTFNLYFDKEAAKGFNASSEDEFENMKQMLEVLEFKVQELIRKNQEDRQNFIRRNNCDF